MGIESPKAVEPAIEVNVSTVRKEGKSFSENRSAETGFNVTDRRQADFIDAGEQRRLAAHIVACVHSRRTRHRPPPLSCGDVHHARHRLSILCIERARDQLNFLNEVLIHLYHLTAVKHIGHGDSVDPICNFALAASAQTSGDKACLEREHLGKFRHGERAQLVLSYYGRFRRLIFSHQRPLGHDNHLLAQLKNGF